MAARHSLILRGIAATVCCLSLLGSLTACNYVAHYQKSNYDYASRGKNDPKMLRARSYGTLSNNPKQHDNQYFEYSSKASYDVKALPGVNTAIVLFTDKNAYVAILTDWTATGTKSHGGASTREQDNTGTTEGVYNVDTGGRTPVGPRVATPYNSYFTHKDVSDLSSELKQVIADTVRKDLPLMQEVHISANQEFVNQMLEFAKLAWGGENLQSYTPQFNKLVQYMFSRGNDVPLPLYEAPPSGASSPAESNTSGAR
ncbi:hypothetical protein COLU111180_02795 [Cohnella lubricantis]|uniref:Uncharacterized protein n=1 Tax=Cohnella lubricantis TaxID=2163172 RepID=A0A841T755_9BACL|nr:hypothetical protein [Cohnella lubricantis]MBB6675755.1 hypothetical protein [Cohnella lubricantis]MBP2118899.1 hypothetical protein [Cohnella lubricantis]